MRGCRVVWLHRSAVYHRAVFRYEVEGTYTGCGVLVFCPRFRAQENTEHFAQQLGLRRCGHCHWPPTTAAT